MPQTPKSISVPLSGNAVTAYTVPAGATAVLKTAVAANVVGTTSNITVQKISGGQPYPLIVDQPPVVTPATGGTAYNSKNLIDGPVTLAAGETISVYDNATPLFKFPQTSTQFIPTESSSYGARAMLFGNSIYVVVVRDATNNKSMILRSTDANTWTEIATGNLLGLSNTYFIARNGSTWVVGQWNTPNYMYSTDNALTWTAGALPTGANIYDVETDGTSRVVFCTALGVYTSTSLPTTTLNTTLNTLSKINDGGEQYQIQSASWNGTYWFLANNYGTWMTTDFVTFSGFYSPFGGSYQDVGYNGVRWSSTYSRYYVGGRGGANGDAVSSSTDGINWTITALSGNFATGGAPRICTAGSSSTLIYAASGSNSMYKSTNGTTWTAGTNVRSGYNWMIEGLANGTFVLTQQYGVGNAFYITTDPTTSTGTFFNPSGIWFDSQSAYYVCAASDGTGWVLVGYDFNNSQTAILYGSNSTTYTSYATIASVFPSQVLWWQAAGVYVLYAGGNVYTSPTGGTWTQRAFMQISGTSATYTVVGGVLYAIGNTGAISDRIYSLTAAQFASSTTMVSNNLLTSAYSSISNGYRTNGQLIGNNYYLNGCLASNGTDVLVTTNAGPIWAYTPSISNVIRTPGAGGLMVDRVNNLDLVYTGAMPTSNMTRGFFYGSNVVTAFPVNNANAGISGNFSTALSTSPASTPNRFGSKVIFYGGTYYATLDNVNVIGYATNIKLWTNYNISNQSIGGLNPVQASFGDFPQYRIQTDGTNFLTYSTTAQRLTVYKGTTPLNTLASSTATLGLIEIT
jgi:hypothetical protein